MALLRPSKRDIVRAAAHQARQAMEAEVAKKRQELAEVEGKLYEQYFTAKDKSIAKAVKELQPFCNDLNKVLAKHGFEPKAKVVVNCGERENAPIVVSVGYIDTNKTTTYTYPEKKANQKYKKQYDDKYKEIREFEDKKHRLTDDFVLFGKINESLNGEASAALNELAKHLRQAAINIPGC